METNKPYISIGMPVYNGERFLEEALDSILAQSFEDFELIISDNASTDKTQAICRAYAAKDQRIRYYRNEQNLGASWNHNRVFELSTSEYFKWAAHDDICKPTYLEQCVEVLDRDPSIVLCYARTTLINQNSEVVSYYPDNLNLDSPKPRERYKKFHDRFRYGSLCSPQYGVIRAGVLRMTPLQGNYPSADEVLLGELSLRGRFHEIPERLFLRRDHPQRSTRAHATLSQLAVWFDPANQDRILLTRWRRLFEYLASISRVELSWYTKAHCYVEVGKWAWQRRINLAKDLKSFAIAIIQHPRKTLAFKQRSKTSLT